MEQLLLPLAPADVIEPASLEQIFRRVFRRMGMRRAPPDFQVEFRPFAGLRSTIALRGDRGEVRLSDILSQAPPLVLEGLAEILLAQLFRRRPSREARECYLAYTFQPAVRERVDQSRRERGRKRLLAPHGRHFDLEEIFAELNRKCFRGELASARIGWSRQRSRTTLGHYDDAHRAITITRWFDSPRVPRELVEYVVYHEMLHIRFPTEHRGHRRVVHSAAFRKAEKQFPKYKEAMRQLHRLSGAASLD